MINLENLEFAIFDFDDTLCVHIDHTGNPDEGEKQYNKNILTFGADHYNNKGCEDNILLKRFMLMCKEKKARLGLMSATKSFQHMQAKNEWIKRRYGLELENFSVGKFDYKLELMIAISDAYNIPRDRILLVDDCWEQLERGANAGFQTASPIEVVNYVLRNQ